MWKKEEKGKEKGTEGTLELRGWSLKMEQKTRSLGKERGAYYVEQNKAMGCHSAQKVCFETIIILLVLSLELC